MSGSEYLLWSYGQFEKIHFSTGPPITTYDLLCIMNVSIFDVSDNARQLVSSIDEHFDQAVAVANKAGPDAPPIKVLWLDVWDDAYATLFVGACCSSIQTIVEKAGAKYVFDDQGIKVIYTWNHKLGFYHRT
jgi:hypothetical protein